MQRITNVILFIGFALCLIQVWAPHYYLTGDGPCHLYNAQVLHDLWSNKNTAFYEHFYKLVYQPNPNWLSTILLAILMFIANGIVAEKIFLTLYIILFVSGFYLLLKKISNNVSLWTAVIFIFVFPHVLYKGFYNYSISIAFYFWVVWGWLHLLEKKKTGNALLFLLFLSLVFFSHLLAFVFSAATCGALAVSNAIAAGKKEQRRTAFIKDAGLLLLLLSPFIILLLWFTGKEGGMQVHFTHHFYRLIELVQFKHIIGLRLREEMPFTTVSGSVLLLLFFLVFTRFRDSLYVHRYDGFLWTLAFVAFVYLFFPDDILGRAMDMSLRTQLFVFVLVVCCIAFRLPFVKIKNTGALIVFVCFIVLSIIRSQTQVIASNAVADYISAGSYIQPNSVVLPLGFIPNGKDERDHIIADWNNSFSHASEYLGIEKPLVILDNYEANMGYFPLRWNERVNPYNHLSKGAGIEGIPPFAKINEYKQASGVTIDYILMFGYKPFFLADEHFKELYAEINDRYHIIYASQSGRTILYTLNKQP